MDNFLQVLILLIIIFSAFANIFGKKKAERQRVGIPQDTKGEDLNDSSPQYSQNEIFGDIFGNKIPREQIPPEIQNQVDVKENVKIIQPDINTNVAVNLSIPIAVDAASITNRRTLDLKMKIKNPATLSEIILISEILNKPKALRR